MKIEAGGAGNKRERRETAAEIVSRFLADENSEKPPPRAVEPLPVKEAALAAMVAFSNPSATSQSLAAPISETREHRSNDQIALDKMVVSINRSAEQRELDKMIADIVRAPVDDIGEESFMARELKCLKDNVYHEARGEPPEGRYAVIFSTLERALDKRYPKTICGVVHQPWQFSWTKDKKVLSQPINPREYLKIAVQVHELMKGRSIDSAAAVARMKTGLPNGAIFYKKKNFTGSEAVEKFFATLVHVATVGTHNFFVERAEDLKKFVTTSHEAATPSKIVPLPRPSPLRQQRQAGRTPES